jgi:hypothetical protein
MFEFFGLIATLVMGWAWILLPALVLLAIFLEHHSRHGWVLFFGLCILGISHFYFAIPIITLLLYSAGYIPVGILWSFWRYKRHTTTMVDRINKMDPGHYRQEAIRKLHPMEMIGTLVTWIMIWPFSVIENLIKDILSAIESLVTRVFRGVYHRIYEKALSQIKVK